uniref:Venom protein family 2 protein 7 n=1 Tax=Lethocerus distinctifemur TaxID=280095 RepID=A0A2K8JLR0_9HEMI|nr:venom protein family 2 protein 7 [Lethocerus distinctifemur]
MKAVSIFLFGLVVVAVFSRACDGHPVPEEVEEEDDGDDDESARAGFMSLARIGLTQTVKQGMRVVGQRLLSSTVTKLITSGAVKLAKSAVVKSGKKYMIKLGKELAQEAAMAAGEAAVESAIEALNSTPDTEREVDLFEYLDEADICSCSTNSLCSCCAKLGDFPSACIHFQPLVDLWTKKSKIVVTGLYGNDTVYEEKFAIGRAFDKCSSLRFQDDTKLKLCVITVGTTDHEGNKEKCFDLRFNDQLLRKCIQQTKDLKLSMRYYTY